VLLGHLHRLLRLLRKLPHAGRGPVVGRRLRRERRGLRDLRRRHHLQRLRHLPAGPDVQRAHLPGRLL
jgi:hypothetical protein